MSPNDKQHLSIMFLMGIGMLMYIVWLLLRLLDKLEDKEEDKDVD